MAIYNGTGTTVTRTDGTLEPGVPMKYFASQADLDEYLKTNPTGDWYAAIADKLYANIYFSPNALNLSGSVGENIKSSFQIVNNTSSKQTVTVSVPSGDTASDWVKVDTTNASVDAGKSSTVNMTIYAPTGTKAGKYTASINGKYGSTVISLVINVEVK